MITGEIDPGGEIGMAIILQTYIMSSRVIIVSNIAYAGRGIPGFIHVLISSQGGTGSLGLTTEQIVRKRELILVRKSIIHPQTAVAEL